MSSVNNAVFELCSYIYYSVLAWWTDRKLLVFSLVLIIVNVGMEKLRSWAVQYIILIFTNEKICIL